MFSSVRRRVTYANVIVTVALVFAMSGGAYAASKYLITSTRQISPKVLRALQGKAGKAGAAGPAGPAGPAGAQGPAGANGKDGLNGSAGTSVTSAESKAKAIGPCKEGGSEFKTAGGTTYACNGEKGKEGTFGGSTLPSGKTLKGGWAASGYGEASYPNEGTGYAATGVSFALPLSVALRREYLIIKEGETPPAECPGTAKEPAAAPGYLCIFVTNSINLHGGSAEIKSNLLGFTLTGFNEAKGPVVLEGTWAVTAE
jgi:hypothetical protein